MTTETVKKPKTPGMPNDALSKSAELAKANARFQWAKDEYDRDITQLLFPDSGREMIAPTNTWLIAHLIDRNEWLEEENARLNEVLEAVDD